MDQNTIDGYYAANIGLVDCVARKGYARIQKIGGSYDYEDLFQDLSITFINAYKKFDESKGNQFSTYFITAAHNRINTLADKIFEERSRFGVRSFEEMSIDGCDVYEILDVNGSVAPEVMIDAYSYLTKAIAKLSPVAATMAQWMLEPPDFVLREVKAAMDHVQYARDSGQEKRFKNPDTALIAKLMQLLEVAPKITIAEARKEVQRFMDGLRAEIESCTA